MKNIAVFGASGTIANEFVNQLANTYKDASIHAISRSALQTCHNNVQVHQTDYYNEEALKALAKDISANNKLDLVIVATGILHDDQATPEKALSQLTAEKLQHIYTVNTVVPALIAKHMVPKLNKENNSMLMALSARIGSISDNGLGGWYSYRASKSALNMLLKTAAIETARKNPNAIIIGMHPGTVDSPLSKPFQRNIPAEKLFTPEFAISKMLEVMSKRTPDDTGKCFGWDGAEIQP